MEPPGRPAPPAPEAGSRRRPLSLTAGGLIGTLLLLVVVSLCVRLGFWQLSRHEDRQERNRQVAARLTEPPLTGAAALTDTTGIFYRAVTLEGTWDNGRSVVLPGRSLRGVPGVHLLTPLLLAERGGGVLVNRGWVPSPDAATIDPADFDDAGAITVTGLVLPFPGAHESLAQRTGGQTGAATGFRRVWYTVDAASLRAQYPYPLLPVLVQMLPRQGTPATPGRGGYPAALEPPPLDDGPHLGYALQWFSFALIGLIGWVALVVRSQGGRPAASPRTPETTR